MEVSCPKCNRKGEVETSLPCVCCHCGAVWRDSAVTRSRKSGREKRPLRRLSPTPLGGTGDLFEVAG